MSNLLQLKSPFTDLKFFNLKRPFMRVPWLGFEKAPPTTLEGEVLCSVSIDPSHSHEPYPSSFAEILRCDQSEAHCGVDLKLLSPAAHIELDIEVFPPDFKLSWL